MELWIRNQDKTRLTMVNDLYLVHDENNACDYIGSNMVGHLAKYTIPGRALEILDEIEKLIKPITIFENCEVDKSTLEKIMETGYCVVNNDARVEQFSQVFYQMPKE